MSIERFERRRRIAVWVAQHVMPHEPHVRRWLARSRASAEDVDELIQESYCRLAMLETTDHIGCPKSYFFSVARSLLVRRLKRRSVVSIEAIAEIEAYRDDAPSPEETASSAFDKARLDRMIALLPDKCRQIVQLRKLEEWSQKRIAEHLGTTEAAVEKQIWLGVKSIRAAWHRAESQAEEDFTHLGQGREIAR